MNLSVETHLPAPNYLAAVLALENSICDFPQCGVQIRHYFAPGLYAREATIEQGVTLVGAIHKTQHICVISQGTLSVTTEDGVKTLSAPCTFISPPGAKRAGFAHTDVVFTNFHPTNETDLEKLAIELTYSTADELLGGSKNKQLTRSALLEAA